MYCFVLCNNILQLSYEVKYLARRGGCTVWSEQQQDLVQKTILHHSSQVSDWQRFLGLKFLFDLSYETPLR